MAKFKVPKIRGKSERDPRQLSLFYPESDWKCPDLNSLPDLKNVEAFAIDIEARDPPLKERGSGFLRHEPTSYVVGYAIATDEFEAYLPIAHGQGTNLDKGEVLRYIRHITSGTAVKVMHNAQFDLAAMYSDGVETQGPIADTLVAAALLDERLVGGYSLNNVSNTFLNIPGKDEVLLEEAALAYGVEAKSGLWYLPPKYVGPYAENDASITYQLYVELVDKLEREGLGRVWELEKKVAKIAFLMSMRGTPINIDRTHELDKSWSIIENEHLGALEASFGCIKVDPWASASIAAAIQQDYPSLEIPLTPKGEMSITNEWLESIQENRPGIQFLVEFRKINKMRRDFINGAILDYQVDGRIHAGWHQTKRDEGGTTSGRFASSDPNLQQVPVRHPIFGPAIRSLFIPEPNELLVCGDYNSQEIRIFLHIAWELIVNAHVPIKDDGDVCKSLIARYHKEPLTDLHAIVRDLMGIKQRSDAKTINFAILYAAGLRKLSMQLGRPMAEAARMLEEHKRILPFAQAVLQYMINLAHQRGYIRTILGRRRRFQVRGNMSDRRLGYHKALNAAVQGTAADQVKAAIVRIYENLSMIPLIQVHDELVYSVPYRDVSLEIKREMELALPLHLPVIADVHVGHNWAEAKGH